MTHLSSSELVDFLEGALPPGRAAHVAACDRCRARAAEAADALARASNVEVPEPSPLFWDHFSTRVREAIASERPDAPRRFAWPWLRPVPLALIACLATILIALTLPRGGSTAPPPATNVVAASSGGPAEAGAGGAAGNVANGPDAAWDLLSVAVSDVGVEEAHAAGLTVGPGEVDGALVDMTPVERAALGRLLQQELKRAGA
jgi:hypothetical protein